MSYAKAFTIQRSRWLRGGKRTTYLYDQDGQMCCLGFYGVACGIKTEDLQDLGVPSDVGTGPRGSELLSGVARE